MGRQALTELREMLGVLRTGDGQERRAQTVPLAAVSMAAAAAASRAAAEDSALDGPCLSELDELIGQSAAAGMVVDLTVEGDPRPYGAEVEQTAYRVVQEALTNVHKHAAGAKTHVRLAHRGGEIAMQVENEPPPAGLGRVRPVAVRWQRPARDEGAGGRAGRRLRVRADGGRGFSGVGRHSDLADPARRYGLWFRVLSGVPVPGR